MTPTNPILLPYRFWNCAKCLGTGRIVIAEGARAACGWCHGTGQVKVAVKR